MRTIIFIMLCLVNASASAAPERLAVTGGTLIDPATRSVLANPVILIEDGVITQVGKAGETGIPPGTPVLDAKGKWIIPGLIDSHVHFFQSGGLYTRPDAFDLRSVKSYEQEIDDVRAAIHDTFARYLASGVTAVADMGGPYWNFTVRDLAARTPRAPRVVVAGPLISTYKPRVLSDVEDPPIIPVTSADEARRLVRQQAKRKPDFIKIWYVVLPQQTPQMFLPIVEAVIEESHAAGIRVAVHATELETARAAVKAGADVLVHSVEDERVDDEFIRLLREGDVIYMPTLAVGNGYLRTASQQHAFMPAEFRLANPYVMDTLFDLRTVPADAMPDWVRKLLREPPTIAPPAIAMENLRLLHAAGVTIAASTDAGNIGTLHGPAIFREFRLMAEAGLSPMEILATATVGGARVFDMEGELGVIRAGAHADLVVLNTDPRRDIGNTANIHRVIRNGVVLDVASLLEPSPADVVQRQVNAYNARDIDAFVAAYSPAIEIYRYPDKLLMAGRAALRKEYAALFDETPSLHCEILEREVKGNIVVDRERITGGEKPVEASARYEVRDGLITRVWFMPEPQAAAGLTTGIDEGD